MGWRCFWQPSCPGRQLDSGCSDGRKVPAEGAPALATFFQLVQATLGLQPTLGFWWKPTGGKEDVQAKGPWQAGNASARDLTG